MAGELGLKGLNFSFKSFISFAGGRAGEGRKERVKGGRREWREEGESRGRKERMEGGRREWREEGESRGRKERVEGGRRERREEGESEGRGREWREEGEREGRKERVEGGRRKGEKRRKDRYATNCIHVYLNQTYICPTDKDSRQRDL